MWRLANYWTRNIQKHPLNKKMPSRWNIIRESRFSTAVRTRGVSRYSGSLRTSHRRVEKAGMGNRSTTRCPLLVYVARSNSFGSFFNLVQMKTWRKSQSSLPGLLEHLKFHGEQSKQLLLRFWARTIGIWDWRIWIYNKGRTAKKCQLLEKVTDDTELFQLILMGDTSSKEMSNPFWETKTEKHVSSSIDVDASLGFYLI